MYTCPHHAGFPAQVVKHTLPHFVPLAVAAKYLSSDITQFFREVSDYLNAFVARRQQVCTISRVVVVGGDGGDGEWGGGGGGGGGWQRGGGGGGGGERHLGDAACDARGHAAQRRRVRGE